MSQNQLIHRHGRRRDDSSSTSLKASALGPLQSRCWATAPSSSRTASSPCSSVPRDAAKVLWLTYWPAMIRLIEGKYTLTGSRSRGRAWTDLVVFQETALFPWMTTFENVSYGPRVQSKCPKTCTQGNHEIAGARRARRLHRQVPLTTFGRHDAAGRTGQSHDQPAEGHAHGRTVPGAGCHDPGPDAGVLRASFREHQGTNLFVTSEIEEAIFLGDRLLIISNRPATIRKFMEINLPRPRQFHMLTSKEYLEYKGERWKYCMRKP